MLVVVPQRPVYLWQVLLRLLPFSLARQEGLFRSPVPLRERRQRRQPSLHAASVSAWQIVTASAAPTPLPRLTVQAVSPAETYRHHCLPQPRLHVTVVLAASLADALSSSLPLPSPRLMGYIAVVAQVQVWRMSRRYLHAEPLPGTKPPPHRCRCCCLQHERRNGMNASRCRGAVAVACAGHGQRLRPPHLTCLRR